MKVNDLIVYNRKKGWSEYLRKIHIIDEGPLILGRVINITYYCEESLNGTLKNPETITIESEEATSKFNYNDFISNFNIKTFNKDNKKHRKLILDSIKNKEHEWMSLLDDIRVLNLILE